MKFYTFFKPVNNGFPTRSQSFGYFRLRNTKMRLTLLFILLFSVLSGPDVSASHAAFSTQVFHHSAKQQIISGNITCVPGLDGTIDFDTVTEIFIVDDDMEDDEDKGNLSFKKCKIPANPTLAFSQIILLSSLHSYYLPAAPVRSSSSCKYIAHRNLRV